MKSDKKKLILQSILLIALLTIIVTTVTVAWFDSSKVTTFNEISIQSASTKNFSISLDGYNYKNQINMKFAEDEDDSYVELRDVASVVSNTLVDGTPFTTIKMYNPSRSEYTGDPNLDGDWTLSNPTDIAYDGSTYYYPSNSSSDSADYIEFDMWVRSDSKLDVYLGDESYLDPYTDSFDVNDDTIYAMYANETIQCPYTIDDYVYDADNSFSKLTYINYYEGLDNDLNIVLLKDTIYYYFNSDKTSMFKMYAGDSDMYDENGKTIIVSTLTDSTSDTLLKNLIALVDEYNTSPETWTVTPDTVNTQTYLSTTLYYDEDGEQLDYQKVKTIVSNNNVEQFDTKIYHLGSNVELDVEVEVLKASNYGQETYTYYLGNSNYSPLTCVKHYFSKNLIVGAIRVSFTDITNGYESLQYVWNPHPEYKFEVGANGLATFSIDSSLANETLQCFQYSDSSYSVSSLDSTYTLNGTPKTTDASPDANEKPLCSLDTVSNGKYSIRKVRVRIWLEGLDSMADNSMLSSNIVGNGIFKMHLNLVSTEVNTLVTKTATNDPKYFIMEANKAVGTNGTFTWSTSNSSIAEIIDSPSATLLSELEITSLEDNQKILEFKYPGSVVVYATPNKGEMGTCSVKYDLINIIKVFNSSDTDNYYYKLTACLYSGEDITNSTSAIWKYNNSNVAIDPTVIDDPYEVYVLATCPKTTKDLIVTVTYYIDSQEFTTSINIGNELVLSKTLISYEDRTYTYQINVSLLTGEVVTNSSNLVITNSLNEVINPIVNENTLENEYFVSYTTSVSEFYVDASYTYLGNVYTGRIYLRGGN